MADHCSCRGDRHPDGSLIVTVGCRVHHRMPDGCLAADHEVLCEGCGQFLCDHDCAWYDQIDPDVPEDDRSPSFLCAECGAYGEANGAWRKQP